MKMKTDKKKQYKCQEIGVKEFPDGHKGEKGRYTQTQ